MISLDLSPLEAETIKQLVDEAARAARHTMARIEDTDRSTAYHWCEARATSMERISAELQVQMLLEASVR